MLSTSMNDFKIEKVLGKGSFGSVYLVTRKEDGQIYALKSVIMEKLNKKEQENSVNEVRILASVNHPNVIGYKEAFWDDQNNTLNIVMEYADDGDLQTKIQKMKKNCGFFDEELIWSYSIQMIEGLKALHDKNIMHRDLKSANIFLVKNKRQCKIGDMNVSKVIKEKVLRTQTGTPYYASPEVWNDKPYSYKSDLWSIGCVIYELCALKPPFKGKDLDELYINVCKGKVERINKVYSDNLWKMIMLLLQVDVNKRVDCDQFLNHPLIVKKIKEMKEKNIEFKDLEDNKSLQDGYLLNTINFKDLREIKAQLPKRKNYENNKNDNLNYNKNNYYSFGNKKFEFKKHFNDYYNYLNTNINNILSKNNYNSNNIINNNLNLNNNEENKSYNYNYNNEINNINNNHHLKYNELLRNNKAKNQYNYNNIINSKIKQTNNEQNLNLNHDNYNLYENIFHTEAEEKISSKDRISLLKNEKDKLKLKYDLGLNYEILDTEEKIKENLTKMKKEKNLDMGKIGESQSKVIEDGKNNFRDLMTKINRKIDPNIPKYNHLNIINYYNNKSKSKTHNEREKKIKNSKSKDKNAKLISIQNNNKKNKISKIDKNIISTPEQILKSEAFEMNKKYSSSSRININMNSNLPITKINHKKIHNNVIKSSSRTLLNKKNPSYINFIERSKTPSLHFNELSSNNITSKTKKKYLTNNSNYESINNNKSLINQLLTSNFSSLGSHTYLESLQNNINSTESNSKSNNVNIKRINKRIVNFNKKKKEIKDIKNGTNINKNRNTSEISSKKINKNIIKNININKLDINNISQQYSKYPINYTYDFNKCLNDMNLANSNVNEINKNILNEKPKLLINNGNYSIPSRYNTNNISINEKYSMIPSNNTIKNINKKSECHKSNKSFNFINPHSSTNKNYVMVKNSKKLNIRSNSYRMSGHEQNYMERKREFDYKYDLTEPELNIKSDLRKKNSKINFPKTGNLSLFKNDIDLLGLSSTNNGNIFLQNVKLNEPNNHLTNINKANKSSGRYYLNIQNVPKCPQIFNNYYSINGASFSNLPIKVINVFNNK